MQKFCTLERLGWKNFARPYFPLNLLLHVHCNTTTYESRKTSAEFVIRAWINAWYKGGGEGFRWIPPQSLYVAVFRNDFSFRGKPLMLSTR